MFVVVGGSVEYLFVEVGLIEIELIVYVFFGE